MNCVRIRIAFKIQQIVTRVVLIVRALVVLCIVNDDDVELFRCRSCFWSVFSEELLDVASVAVLV